MAILENQPVLSTMDRLEGDCSSQSTKSLERSHEDRWRTWFADFGSEHCLILPTHPAEPEGRLAGICSGTGWDLLGQRGNKKAPPKRRGLDVAISKRLAVFDIHVVA